MDAFRLAEPSSYRAGGRRSLWCPGVRGPTTSTRASATAVAACSGPASWSPCSSSWVGSWRFQAWSAYRHLHRAEALLGTLRSQTLAGDAGTGDATLKKLKDEAASAHDSLSGPHWALAAHLPFVGDDIGAARTVSAGVDTVAGDALPDLLQAVAGCLPQGRKPQGRTDRPGRRRPRPAAPGRGAPRAARGRRRRPGDRAAGPQPAAAQAGGRASSTPSPRVRRGTEAAATAARVLPSMLGAEKPRTYLILNQNTAEQRVLGGIPGSILLARASHGKVSLVAARTAAEVNVFDQPVVPLTEAERTLHGDVLAQYMSNVTDVPDFARGASIARTMWAKRYGQKVDGVIATDPYALQLILRAIGPVQVGDGPTLTGSNAARLLLNKAYFDFRARRPGRVLRGRGPGGVHQGHLGGAQPPRPGERAVPERRRRDACWSGRTTRRSSASSPATG